MNFDIDKDFAIFEQFLGKRPEVIPDTLKSDLKIYYLPYVEQLLNLKNSQSSLVIGISAIQGTGKTTQGEVLEILLNHLGHKTISLSIDDFYLPYEDLKKLRENDQRFIRRGVTHDINLAKETLLSLKEMTTGQVVKIPVYDKGAKDGDGDRTGWREVSEKPDFIFFNGWMVGARRVENEAIFESGLPSLDSPEHIQFAKDINKKLDEYLPIWDMFDFLTILYVPDYMISLKWRNQAEDVLRREGKGMSSEEIEEFVYYFWRSVHPAIQIKAIAYDQAHTNLVVIIANDHTVKEVLTPAETAIKYP